MLCHLLSTDDASSGDIDDRVIATVLENFCVGLLLSEEGMRRDVEIRLLVVLLELVTEDCVVEEGILVVLSDVSAGLLVVGSLDFSVNAALSGVVGSQQFRDVIAEVGSGAEVTSGMAVEPFNWLASTGLNPECVTLREISGELDAACHDHVSYVPDLRQEYVLTMVTDRLGIAVESVAHLSEEVIITRIAWLSDDLSKASLVGCVTSTVAPQGAQVDVCGG